MFSQLRPPPRPCTGNKTSLQQDFQNRPTSLLQLDDSCLSAYGLSFFPPMNPLQMASLPGSHFTPGVPLGKFPSTQISFSGPPPSPYAVDLCCLPGRIQLLFPVPCSRSTPTLARTYFGHDNLAYYYSRQSQSGLWILWIICQRNLLRIPFGWLLGEGSFGDRGRRASLNGTTSQGCGVLRSLVDRGIFLLTAFQG
jgi:hypothetical protein